MFGISGAPCPSASPRPLYCPMSPPNASLLQQSRFVFCAAAALLNGVDLGFQGNGNLIWGGVFLGLVLGLAWSIFLLFGIPRLARNSHPSVRTPLSGLSLFVALTLFGIICFHIWGNRKIGIGPLRIMNRSNRVAKRVATPGSHTTRPRCPERFRGYPGLPNLGLAGDAIPLGLDCVPCRPNAESAPD